MAILVKRTGYYKYRTVGKSRPLQAINKHLKYIEANRDKHRNEVVLFSRDEDQVDRKDFYQKIKEQKPHGVVAHKLVISLHEEERDRTGVNLKDLVRESMSQYESKYKQQLDWIAAIHDDPKHPHAHLVIRGRCEVGKSVYIDVQRMKHLAKIADAEKGRVHKRNIERGWSLDPEPWIEKERDWLEELQKERELLDRDNVSNETLKRNKEKERGFER
ncbi:relaxase/mobilization nuclease domain-containing protein [Hazenella coriacea]|uniref:MobA/VirD2-like nuclease domain-containing protein n=1 Tax=Hazenella coriacea TaxID=1179467 RepID=A0A4R3L2A7_9BACL|nr:relaxase [Hazenella coriacea]TCS92219.1 hypothetical protein EDD58_11410 [Hazenella coriacea]